MNHELTKTYLNVNEYEGETYFSKEKFESLLDLLYQWFVHQHLATFDKIDPQPDEVKEVLRFIKKVHSLKEYLQKQAKVGKYHYNKLLEIADLDMK